MGGDSLVDMKLRTENENGDDETDSVTGLRGQNQTVSGNFIKNAKDSDGEKLSKVMTEIERLSMFLTDGEMKLLEKEDEIETRLKLQLLHKEKMDIMKNLE